MYFSWLCMSASVCADVRTYVRSCICVYASVWRQILAEVDGSSQLAQLFAQLSSMSLVSFTTGVLLLLLLP